MTFEFIVSRIWLALRKLETRIARRRGFVPAYNEHLLDVTLKSLQRSEFELAQKKETLAFWIQRAAEQGQEIEELQDELGQAMLAIADEQDLNKRLLRAEG